MLWCKFDHDTKDIFYMCSQSFRYAEKATYEAAYGSSFSADVNEPLPGHRGRIEQYTAVRYGGYFYIPSVEGIYRLSWPSLSWELAIGKPGSGALSESITLECDYPVTITLTQDGSIDLLMIAVENERMGWTQIIFVKLSDLSLYAKSRIMIGRSGSPKALLG